MKSREFSKRPQVDVTREPVLMCSRNQNVALGHAPVAAE
jgi:hypothetical protein